MVSLDPTNSGPSPSPADLPKTSWPSVVQPAKPFVNLGLGWPAPASQKKTHQTYRPMTKPVVQSREHPDPTHMPTSHPHASARPVRRHSPLLLPVLPPSGNNTKTNLEETHAPEATLQESTVIAKKPFGWVQLGRAAGDLTSPRRQLSFQSFRHISETDATPSPSPGSASLERVIFTDLRST